MDPIDHPRTIPCDGCQSPIKEPVQVSNRRQLLKLNYGACCADSVRAHLKARDALHDAAADSFRAGLDLLRQDWLRDHPAGRIPE